MQNNEIFSFYYMKGTKSFMENEATPKLYKYGNFMLEQY